MLRPRVETQRDVKARREVQASEDARMLAARVRCEDRISYRPTERGPRRVESSCTMPRKHPVASVAALALSNVEQSFLDSKLELASLE